MSSRYTSPRSFRFVSSESSCTTEIGGVQPVLEEPGTDGSGSDGSGNVGPGSAGPGSVGT